MIIGRSAILALLLASSQAEAATQSVYAVPSGWRIENYTAGESVYIWYTGAACGAVHLGGGATQKQQNRLWSTMITGKTTNKPVGIYYDDVSCEIISFYASEI